MSNINKKVDLAAIARARGRFMGLLYPNRLQYSKNGILYDLTDDMRAVVKRLESDGRHKVWHVVKGEYVLGGVDRCVMTSYLLVTDEDDEELQDAGNYGYYAFAWVDNDMGEDMSEYGDICIRGCMGGLIRTA